MTKGESSGGDGIDLKKRQRSPLSPNFYHFKKQNQEIWRQQRSEERSVTAAVTTHSVKN
ncbi:hypothetical protein [Paenibacillus sp.]|uniref:hypothetical protein n=1 Tax=Paenibacillus sp. TaxID=58172 RepID=UPI002833B8A7|nr:hypothetical protein [Paenibacillus sp.]MDR0271285.1 hypothetical protein [Paenibacillus sp.]